jgi:hypothetical protein
MLWWQFAAERPWLAFFMLVLGAVLAAFMWSVFCSAIVFAVRGERGAADIRPFGQ